MTTTYNGSQSVDRSPEFSLYKTVEDAAEGAGPYTEKKHGVATDNWLSTIVDIACSASANPAIDILFWSDAAGAFVVDDDVATITAKGAGVSYQKVVNSAGRRIFVLVGGTVPASESVEISLAGTELEHP